MRPEFRSMIGPDLVKVHNEMAIEAARLEVPDVTTTKRFATREAGVKRCEELYQSLCIKKGEEYTPHPLKHEGEHDVATKTKTPKAKTAKTAKTKKAGAPKKPKAAKAPKAQDTNPISEACGVRRNTNRERLLLCLHANLGKQVPLGTALKATYKGSEEPSTNTPFLIIARDLPNILKRAKAPFEIRAEKDDAGKVGYGLYKK